MSYEILYGRQFLDLGNDTYVPIILSGSNNCSMFHNGREIRERHWWSFGSYGGGDPIAKSKEGWVQWITDRVDGNPEGEWFMRGSKWLLGKDMIRWFESGIKSAYTIEQIVSRLPSQSLHCAISIYNKDIPYAEKGHHRFENEKFIRTTEELVKWVEDFEARRTAKAEAETVYADLQFSGIEPLGLGPKPQAKGPLMCKIGKNCYLSHYRVFNGMSEHSYGPDVTQALVFDSEEDFKEKTRGVTLPRNYRLVKAVLEPLEYAIKVSEGCYTGQYVLKKTRNRVHFTYGTLYAKKFASEKAAQSYIDKMLAGRFPNTAFAPVKIEQKKKQA